MIFFLNTRRTKWHPLANGFYLNWRAWIFEVKLGPFEFMAGCGPVADWWIDTINDVGLRNSSKRDDQLFDAMAKATE